MKRSSVIAALGAMLLCFAAPLAYGKDDPYLLLRFPEHRINLFLADESALATVVPKRVRIQVTNRSRRELTVSGVGQLTYKAHVVEIQRSGISVDGEQLTKLNAGEWTNFIMLPSGQVQRGSLRAFDRIDIQDTQGYRPSSGYVPDSATAIRIAEAVLIPVYGQQKIVSERPFQAELQGDVWQVEGTLHCPAGNSRVCLGGTAVVKLSKTDGRILFMIHGK